MTTDRTRTIGRLALPLAAALLTACGGGGDDGGPQDGPPGAGPAGETATPSVEAVEAREGTLPLRERLTGTVRAAGQVVISPQVSGPVVEVLAQNGERVEAGDPLVRIRAETGRSQLQQARANLENTRAQMASARAQVEELEAQFERTQALAEDSLVSREALETQRSQLEAARAEYEQMQAQVEEARATVEEREEALDQSVVRAPIDGRVGQRNVEVGMRVDPQTSLYTIGRLEDMQVEVPVPQDLLTDLDVGQPVEIQAESMPDTVISAQISRISPFLQEGSFSGQVEIDVPNHGGLLMPGMFVTVDVLHGQTSSTTLLPKSALYDNPATGERGVYVIEAADTDVELVEGDSVGELSSPVEARFRQAEVDAEGRQLVGLRNVEPGAWVVVVGQHLLTDVASDGAVETRIRPVSWERMVDLQRLQRIDLVRDFLERQQRMARRWRDSLRGDTTSSGSAGSSL